ncbi:MAG: hypothetical protein KJ063_25060, partial [Anaerolineae bacterium]|nr:hypothetical protein [Anaerolineae bacterium]
MMRRLTLLLIVIAVATVVLALFTLFTPTAQADEVGGIIDTDTTWTLAGSPYVMTDTVTILPGVTLTVEAGVTVMAHTGIWMDVQGGLQAVGTTTDPILFTSLNDSAANQWSGVYINSSGSASVERATFRYAATAWAVAGSSNAPVYLTHTLFENNLHYPVSVHTASLNRLQMGNVTFSNNAFDRIFIEGNTLPDSATLTPQPGLQGYQMEAPAYFEIPNGSALTLAAGVTLFGEDVWMTVNGHLAVNGAITATSTISGFDGIYASDSGSFTADYAHIYGGNPVTNLLGIGFGGNSINPIQLQNTTIEATAYPILGATDALHRLQMENVTFANNGRNRVIIDMYDTNALSENTTLTDQPGLEGYEVLGGNEILYVPQGITLTLAAGSTLLDGDVLFVNGHLAAEGIVTNNTSILNFCVVYFSLTGSADLAHTLIDGGGECPYFEYGIGIEGNSDEPIIVHNSTIQNIEEYPILTNANNLHRLQMENVTFADNSANHVFISTDGGHHTLAGNVTLTSQPGLEGYEVIDGNNLTIPDGLTLTLTADNSLIMPALGHLQVEGRLQAEGTAVAPITFTSATNPQPNAWAGIYVLDNGSVTLQNSIIEFAGIGLDVTSNSGTLAEIQDVVFRENSIPMEISPNNLHLLQMDNVSFENNVRNRVYIHTANNNTLVGDVTLRPQPGLEGYEIELYGDRLVVPQGITLTLEAGTTILFPDFIDVMLQVQGHLQASGTPASPITFTSLYTSNPYAWLGVLIGSDSEPASTGSAYLEGVTFSRAVNGLLVGQIATDDRVVFQDSTFQQNFTGPSIAASNLHKVDINNLTFADNFFNQIVIVSEPLAGDVTLTTQPGLDAYLFTRYEPLQIPTGYTLTLEAGVSLVADSFANHDGFLLVEGRLQAEGTAVQPITFTSNQDNTPGQWQGILVNGGEVSLAHAEVRYAATNLTVNSPTSTVNITSSRFISASVDSIAVNDGVVNAACSVIAGSGQNGVSVAATGNPSVTITTSEIWGNGVGITNSHSLPVDARHNFWGHPSGPGGIGPGSGDAVYGNVLYEPWLAEPTCTPPPPPILPTISISDSTAVESAPFLTFTVTLNITSEQDVLVDYVTV